jgi:hypothetical protein
MFIETENRYCHIGLATQEEYFGAPAKIENGHCPRGKMFTPKRNVS